MTTRRSFFRSLALVAAMAFSRPALMEPEKWKVVNEGVYEWQSPEFLFMDTELPKKLNFVIFCSDCVAGPETPCTGR